MLRIKNNAVTPMSQARLTSTRTAGFKPRIGSILLGEISAREMFTTCVSGSIAIARDCAADGRYGEVKGKKVPARKSIGVMKRKDG